MKTIHTLGLLLVSAALATACSSDGGTNNNTGDAQLALFNTAPVAAGTQLKLDNGAITLPGVGQSSSMSISSGTHQLTLTGQSGTQLAATSFTIPSGGRRTAVFTGVNATAITLAITSDTISTSPGDGSHYHSVVGSMLMVHSAPGAGPYNLTVRQMGGVDSVYQFGTFVYGAGSLPPPAPYGYAIPFVPSTYSIDITSPGSPTSLAHTQFTLATDDRWIVTLSYSIEGGLVLTAVKQQ